MWNSFLNVFAVSLFLGNSARTIPEDIHIVSTCKSEPVLSGVSINGLTKPKSAGGQGRTGIPEYL